MKQYIDITVLPDPEFAEATLMNALYAKCHRALGQFADGKVGVSFPNHQKTLGATLRLHGVGETLDFLMAQHWLKGLGDYTEVTQVQDIPSVVKYRTVRRVIKKSPHNKMKRSVQKGWLTVEQAQERIKNADSHLLSLPYAQLTSLSNKNLYKVFVKHGECSPEPVDGHFTSYGLSRLATVPWF